MQITAACPKCDSRYQFDAALIGQKIRCTNANCREVFEVREAAAEPKPARPAARDRRAPTFDADSGEHRPVRAAAPAGDVPREADWSALPPPPVRSRDGEEVYAAEEEPATASADEALAFMGLAPSAEQAEEDYTLPADVNGDAEQAYEVVEEEKGETDYDELYRQYQRKPRRRWMIGMILGLFAFFVIAGVGTAYYLFSQKNRAVAQLARDAEQQLQTKQYARAAEQFERLITEDQKNASRHRYLRDYARTMDTATDSTKPTEERRKQFTDYLVRLRGDPNAELIKDYQGDIGAAFVRIVDDQVREATRKADAQDFAEAEKLQKEAGETQSLMREFAAGTSLPEELARRSAELTSKIADGRNFSSFVAKVTRDIGEKLSPATVTAIENEAKEKGYQNRPQVIELLDKAKKGLLDLIVYTAAARPAEPLPSGGLTSLIMGPNTDPIPEKPSVVFAVARGVLYAVAEGKGQILWAARVGIDTASLPVRVPATGSIPALVLVPAADGQGLTARETLTGKPRWYQRLPAALRGQPLLVEGRIIAPLADDVGTVMVLESRDGQQLGKMVLNQRIGVGATVQPGTTRIFVPAESQNVFVLDGNPPLADGQAQTLLKFVAMLPTGHGPGSLRAEPVVVGGVDEATGELKGTAYMILTQSDGFHDMKLRSFVLDTQADHSLLARADEEIKLPGWCWFAPVCDQEKVAVVTDAGVLAVLGINQKENQDKTLFPLVVDQPKEASTTAGRGQIVHAEEQGFWYLANGELNYKIKGFSPKDGQRLAPGWKKPVKLGTPLHASQVSADRTTLYLVTQTAAPPAWLMSAVNAQSGSIIWQRPLGLAAQGDPVKLGDYVYQIDQGAGIYAATPAQPTTPAGPEAALGGQVLAGSRSDVVGGAYFLPHPDGKMAFVVYATGDGRTLNAIVVVPGQKASEPLTVQLGAPLAGPPVLADKALIMALGDGGLHRWVIGEKSVKRGPDWRGPRLGETARAFLTLVGKDGVLVTDGHRGLTLYQWPAGAEHQLKQQLNVADRIISAPLALPAKDGATRVAVADAGGRLNLLEGDPLAPTLRWDMKALRKGNEITAGPFLADDKGQQRLIVVADRVTVVCLSLDDRKEAWFYRSKGDGVPHAPRQIGSALVLADVSGRYEAIDVSDGKPLAAPYPPLVPLPAAPASAPIAFGDKLFAPLTDGTVLLIPSNELLKK